MLLRHFMNRTLVLENSKISLHIIIFLEEIDTIFPSFPSCYLNGPTYLIGFPKTWNISMYERIHFVHSLLNIWTKKNNKSIGLIRIYNWNDLIKRLWLRWKLFIDRLSNMINKISLKYSLKFNFHVINNQGINCSL